MSDSTNSAANSSPGLHLPMTDEQMREEEMRAVPVGELKPLNGPIYLAEYEY